MIVSFTKLSIKWNFDCDIQDYLETSGLPSHNLVLNYLKHNDVIVSTLLKVKNVKVEEEETESQNLIAENLISFNSFRDCHKPRQKFI